MIGLLHEKILRDFENITNLRTSDIDSYNRELIMSKIDVSALREHVKRYPMLHRTYFQVSLSQQKDFKEQFQFIDQNLDLLMDWWHVDQLTQFIYKPLDFAYAHHLACKYTRSEETFTRRWGYVLFLTGLQREVEHLDAIWSLLKDDQEYYVQMAEAWLICELVVYHPQKAILLLEQSKLKYNILGKAIQKINDSYRIDKEFKEYSKSLRPQLKKN